MRGPSRCWICEFRITGHERPPAMDAVDGRGARIRLHYGCYARARSETINPLGDWRREVAMLQAELQQVRGA